MFRLALVIILLANPFYPRLQANEIHVSSIAAMQSAIDSASAGDVIVLENGTYLNNALAIGTSNIIVRSAAPGGVYLNGTDVIVITGSYVTFSGFQFTSNTTITGSVIIVSGNHNTLTQLNFNGYSADHLIYISGQYNTVSFSNFQNKLAVLTSKGGTGDLVQIIPNVSVPGYNTIRYCSFQHMPGLGGDFGNECIRIGDGAYSTMISRTIVEYCYFEDTGLGDSETISVKSRENVLRYNTMNNNPDAMFAFRNGDNNVAYGNFFIKSGGIRCKQANNIFCYNNYFELAGTGQTSGLPGKGTAPVYLEYFGTGYGDNFNFINNTFYECTASVIQSPLTNCTWANNIFKQSSGSIFSGSTSGQTFAGNIYYGTLGFSVSSGMTSVDPQLVKNSDGYYGLSSSSPAIDASTASYPPILDIAGIDDDPSLLLDISGRSRPVSGMLKDVGCSEYNVTGTVTNRPLKLSDVGPSYLGGPVTSVAKDQGRTAPGAPPSGFQLDEAYPNPFNPTTTIRFELPGASQIELRILDMLGRPVATLVEGHVEGGPHVAVWDASNFPSGVYFVQLQSERRVLTKKLTLVK